MKKLLFLSILFFAAQVFPQSINASVIDSIAIKLLPINGPGASLLIMKDGEIKYQKAFGFADVENKIQNTNQTVFQIGSVSKQITAAAILLLIENGKLKLDDTLTKFIPDFIEPANKVTIKNLLIHNSGIPSYTELADKPLNWESKNSLDDIIDLIKNRKFDFEPGEKFKYNNSGYAILAYIIQKLSGRSYGDFMREKIFLPLGMKHTADGADTENISQRALGYTLDLSQKEIKKSQYTEFAQLAGAGSIISTTGDIAIWDEAVKNKKLLSTQSWDEALSPQVNAGMFGDSVYYGFGWIIENYFGHKFMWHSGGMAGFLCVNYLFPDNNLTIILLTNTDFVAPSNIAKQIANYILGIGGEERKPIALSPDQLKRYEGIFENPFIKIKIKSEKNKLAFIPTELPFNSINYKPTTDTTFFAEGLYGQKAIFSFDDDSVNAVEIGSPAGSQKYFKRGYNENKSILNLDENYLQKFVGVYNFSNGNKMQIYIKNKKLKALLPGQPEYTLLPIDSTTFELENLQGFKMIFEIKDEGKVTSVTSSQPNGNYKAEKTSNQVEIPKEESGSKITENELKKFEGDYEFGPGNDMKVYIKDGKLKASLKGQPEYSLLPTAKNEFKLQGMQGFKFIFEEMNDKIISVTSHQPNGDFKAIKKN